MSLPRFMALFGVFVASLCAQTSYVVPAKPGTPEVATNGSLEIARTADEVLLNWTLPEGEVKSIEIYRNHVNEAKGRVRVGSVNPTAREFHDKVPDEQIYWYWLKITRPNGVIVNVGATATPSGKVWRPAE